MNVADRLAGLHFTAQHEASTDLNEVEITRLDAFLRAVLFTDGTVSRALEAHTLADVAVEAVEQAPSAAPERIARYLRVEQDEECVRRRVAMRIGGAGVSVWAESHVVPRRLPREFLALLDGDPQGIGGSLQQLKLESWRELLWFGLGQPPPWADGAAPGTTTLTRAYRVLTRGAPALLISEAFVVEMRAGRYHLTGSPESDTATASAAVNGSTAAQRVRRRPPAGRADRRQPAAGNGASPSL
jgi:chorismate-pyruvate lyase